MDRKSEGYASEFFFEMILLDNYQGMTIMQLGDAGENEHTD